MKAFVTGGFVAILVAAFSPAHAQPITSCDVQDATANGAFADECAFSSTLGANHTAETTFVNNNFQAPGEDPFQYIGKFEKDEDAYDGDGALAGFTVTVTVGNSDDGYLFDYQVTVPLSLVGTEADFVLGIKQSTDSFVAYLFEGVTLGIDGKYNNFWINPQDIEVNDYSHASAWIRTTDVQVAEPGSLALLGAGLLGLGWSRRRRASRRPVQ